jgi:hypothetical protein
VFGSVVKMSFRGSVVSAATVTYRILLNLVWLKAFLFCGSLNLVSLRCSDLFWRCLQAFFGFNPLVAPWLDTTSTCNDAVHFEPIRVVGPRAEPVSLLCCSVVIPVCLRLSFTFVCFLLSLKRLGCFLFLCCCPIIFGFWRAQTVHKRRLLRVVLELHSRVHCVRPHSRPFAATTGMRRARE